MTSADLSDLAVDRTSPVPLWFQLGRALADRIASGELPAGAKLENEISLADQLGVSRPTMRKAIEYLVERRLVVRRRGVGTEVSPEHVRRPVRLTSLYDELAAAGQGPTTRVLSLRRAAVGDVEADVSELGLAPEDQVWVIERLRGTKDGPLAVLRNFVPAVVGAARPVLTEDLLGTHGLYELLRTHGVEFASATETIGARPAGAAIARQLEMNAADAVLTVRRVAHDQAGRAVEIGEHAYRADRYSFTVTLSVP